MANGFSDYVENKVIDWVFRGQTMPGAMTTLYFALHTADPGDTGASGVSTSGTAYARQSFTGGLSNFGSTSNTTGSASTGTTGNTKNKVAITWAAGPAGSNWGTVSFWSVWDTSTAGNCLASGALTTNKTINVGDPGPSFAIDALSFTLD